jgi:hypothetical protein
LTSPNLTPALSLKKEREILFFLRAFPRVIDYQEDVEDGPDEDIWQENK